MGLFQCDSCKNPIQAHWPRIHCLDCSDYDCCANCALSERWANGHMPFHKTQTFKSSQPAVLSQTAWITYSAPAPRVLSGNTSPAPPSPTIAQTPQRWLPFFNPDMSPSPTFVNLYNAIFSYLDHTRTGYLAPEQYSKLLDDMGYEVNENVWRMNYRPTSQHPHPEAAADAALRSSFHLFAIDFTVRRRQSGTEMPMLSRRGLLSIASIQVLCEPSREWENLAHIVHKYRLQPFLGWEEMPRNVLPQVADQRMLDRVSNMAAQSQAAGQQALAQAEMGARISAQANLAAVNAVGGTQYEYRTTHSSV